MIDEEINNLKNEIMDLIQYYSHDIALTAVTVCAVSGFISKQVEKKEFLYIMSEIYDEILITKMKNDER